MREEEILDAIERDIRNELPHYQLLGRLLGYRKPATEPSADEGSEPSPSAPPVPARPARAKA